MTGPGWRPIEPAEVPHLLALGTLVRGLRSEFGVTQAALGRLAGVSAATVSAIETARRRTRRSTLERMVRAVVLDEQLACVRLQELVDAAGPALAPPESVQQLERMLKRVERRERRWGQRWQAESERLLDEARRTVAELDSRGSTPARRQLVAKIGSLLSGRPAEGVE